MLETDARETLCPMAFNQPSQDDAMRRCRTTECQWWMEWKEMPEPGKHVECGQCAVKAMAISMNFLQRVEGLVASIDGALGGPG
jgi:hypothetical protein